MPSFGALSELPISALPVAAAPPGGFLAAWAVRKVKVLGSGVLSMYPINAASPERLDVGAVVQISDGAVQTSGVSIKVKPQGGAAAAGGGTTTYEEGIVAYVPTQAETNYTSFQVIAYKTGCIPVAVTVITTASATPGYAGLDWGVMIQKTATNALTNTTVGTVTAVTGLTAANLDAAVSTRMANYTQPTGFLAATFPGTVASTTNITAGTITTATNVTTVNGLAAGVITAASIAADAITDAKVAADVTIASVTGAVGSVTGNVGGSVNSVTNPVDANVVSAATDAFESTDFDTTYYGAMAGAIWDALLITYAADGSLGEAVGLILAKTNNLPASPASTTNISVVGSVTGLTNTTIADAVWDEVIAGHLAAGSTGEALDAASSGGDPWGTALPGAYGAGTAGKIIGDNINATISSRATQTSVDTIDGIVDSILVDTSEIGAAGAGLTAIGDMVWAVPANLGFADNSTGDYLVSTYSQITSHTNKLNDIQAKTDLLPAAPAAVGDIPTAVQNADALLNRDMSAVSDTNARSPLNALRGLRNKSSIVADVLTVTKEDDTTTAWTAATTPAPGADPISAIDPT